MNELAIKDKGEIATVRTGRPLLLKEFLVERASSENC